MRVWLAALAASLATTGCDADQADTIDPVSEAPPCVRIEPEVVLFDAVDVGHDPARTAVVTITNACGGSIRAADLQIDRIELLDPSLPFDLGVLGTTHLSDGSSTDLIVTFEPRAGRQYETSLLVSTNDPSQPITSVILVGDGVAPIIDVDPAHIDFGAPYIGCGLSEPFRISNLGNAELIVSDLELWAASDEVDVALRDDLPFTIAPANAGIDVYLQYLPLDVWADTAYLTVTSNDPANPEVVVSGDGVGTYYGEHVDTFEQPLAPATDVVFFFDRSEGMDEVNAAIIDDFPWLVRGLDELDTDYHVAAAVYDDGCVIGPDPWIDSSFSMSEATAAFETMVDPGVSSGGSSTYTEALFSVAAAALAEVGPGGCNEGLLREGAFLSMVFVSSEPEQSTNSWAYFVTLFQSVKADPDDVRMHAIAGDYPSGCGDATGGVGYYEATVATGGQFLSICTTGFASHMDDLATASVFVDDHFELSQTPVPGTLEVTVDGAPATTGWTWDASARSIVFDDDHVPVGGATIEVFYALMPDCSG